MSLYKRGGTWWLEFIGPNGRRVRESTGTEDKVLAQEYHDHRKVELWRVYRLGERERRAWNDAVVRWVKERSHKATIDTDKMHLRWVDRFLGGKMLDQIDRDLIDRITDVRLGEDVTNATVNRMLEVVRAILRKCRDDWEWVDRIPKVRLLSEPTRRIRWLTREEAERLLANLPPHLASMAAFSLSTGLRRANVTGLQWSQVDLVRRVAWIHPDQAKARRAIPVPLNAEAVVLIRKQLGQHPVYVFSWRGQRITQVSTKAWRLALGRARIEDFRWHDLRHTWASWHVQNGTPLNVLQELGGWESPEMVRRYAHFSTDHLAPYAERLASLRVVGVGADPTEIPTGAQMERA